jgi:hypothetical protein
MILSILTHATASSIISYWKDSTAISYLLVVLDTPSSHMDKSGLPVLMRKPCCMWYMMQLVFQYSYCDKISTNLMSLGKEWCNKGAANCMWEYCSHIHQNCERSTRGWISNLGPQTAGRTEKSMFHQNIAADGSLFYTPCLSFFHWRRLMVMEMHHHLLEGCPKFCQQLCDELLPGRYTSHHEHCWHVEWLTCTCIDTAL